MATASASLVVSASKSYAWKKTAPAFRRPVKARDKVMEAYLCGLCRGILIMAFQTDCGCRFCDLCLQDLEEASAERTCPGGAITCGPFSRKYGDRRPKPDAAVRRQLKTVEICCPNECDEYFMVDDLNDHINNACSNRYCPHCQRISAREEFEKQHGELLCEHCEMNVPRCNYKSEHRNPLSQQFCQKFKGLCPLCQNEEINAEDIQRHRIFCTKWPQVCNYEVLNCSGDHVKNSTTETKLHLSCLLKTFEINRRNVEYSHLDRITEENIHECLEDFKILDSMNRTLKQDDEYTKKIDEYSEKCERLRAETERTHDLFQRLNTIDFQIRQPQAFPVAPYIWRIEDYLNLRKRQSIIDSRPFLSELYGYKMRVRLYLSGDGQGRNTHLSAYIILMAYDYDNLQIWPFQTPFLFTLLDQAQKGQDYQQLIHPNPKSRSFARPPRAEEDNGTVRASGCAKFFPLERLISNCNYLKDENLYIRIDVLNRTQ